MKNYTKKLSSRVLCEYGIQMTMMVMTRFAIAAPMSQSYCSTLSCSSRLRYTSLILVNVQRMIRQMK